MSETTNTIPVGLCQCGCGQRTKLSRTTRREKGRIRGQPLPYIQSHSIKRPSSEGPLFAATFWSRVVIGATDECWLWKGGRGGGWGSYGHLRYKNKVAIAHRVAYELTHGTFERNLKVCHTCDNPICCNPAHLFLGTNQDNMDDKVRKGRQHRPRGVLCGLAKLTENEVREIRHVYERGSREFGSRPLGKRFGVSGHAIWAIIQRRTWSHLTD